MTRMLFAAAVLLATAGEAFAADLPPSALPPRAPATYVPVASPVYNWSGIYIGVNGGYAFGNSSWAEIGGDDVSGTFNTNGFLIGGTIGANYQMNSLVLGVEGDFDWANLDGTTTANDCAGPPAGCETMSNWLATARGRVGYAFDRVLIYGTAGGAFANVQARVPGVPTESHTRTGWTAGGGLEYAFTPNLSLKVEYLFVDLPDTTCSIACFDSPTNVTFTENVVRGGLNFKFSPF